LFDAGQITDWPALAAAIAGPESLKHPLKLRVIELLPGAVRDVLRGLLPAPGTGPPEGAAARIAAARKARAAAPQSAGPSKPPAGQAQPAIDTAKADAVVTALNDLIDGGVLLAIPEIVNQKFTVDVLRPFLPDEREWVRYDTLQAGRAFNRFLLEAVFPAGLARAKSTNPPVILHYRTGRELIGEMALILGVPRTATCVAYSHPQDDPDRTDAEVLLVRISSDLFKKLGGMLPDFNATVKKLADERAAETRKRLEIPPADQPLPRLDTSRADKLGLVQGQALMLIDLERCTRCDECVRACVDSHDDGRSRLYLDGPSVGSFLVPSTCRSCLDPVCMIRCPVNSIQRGNNGEMLIKPWCIGCGTCADDCPYGAIQMHDIGVIPARTGAWRFLPADQVEDPGWFLANRSDRSWAVGHSPFRLDHEFRTQLKQWGARAGAGDPAADAPPSLRLRYAFDAPRRAMAGGSRFLLSVKTPDRSLGLWLNGQPIVPPPSVSEGVDPPFKLKVDQPQARRNSKLLTYEVDLSSRLLSARRNLLAVHVTPCGGMAEPFLDVRLDEVPAPQPWREPEPKAAFAVVCDLCSALEGGPACVTNCPHEAALRVHAPTEVIGGNP
jgi:Fe-S-cluster-containing hydrogenase component 2